jgi:hypothetical protein
MPKIRLAIRSRAIERAAPPRASPSSLVSATPSKPTPSAKALAVLTASWPTARVSPLEAKMIPRILLPALLVVQSAVAQPCCEVFQAL